MRSIAVFRHMLDPYTLTTQDSSNTVQAAEVCKTMPWTAQLREANPRVLFVC